MTVTNFWRLEFVPNVVKKRQKFYKIPVLVIKFYILVLGRVIDVKIKRKMFWRILGFISAPNYHYIF